MADTAIAISAGTGTNVDTRTEATNGNHRQVIVVGDPSTNAGVAPVDATTGLVVNIGPGVALNTGASSATTQRIVLASDSPGVGVDHASTTSGTKVALVAGAAVSAESTAVTTGQTAHLVTDLVGKLLVLPYANPENFLTGTVTLTDTTSTSIIAAQGAGNRIYVTDMLVTNSSSTPSFVTVRDGSGGTVLWEGYAAASGGGWAKSLLIPVKTTANTALHVKCESSTGASTIVSISGYKGI